MNEKDKRIAERLEAWAAYAEGGGPQPDYPAVRNSEAAAYIRELKAEDKRLREALRDLIKSVEETFDTRRGAKRHLVRLNNARKLLNVEPLMCKAKKTEVES